MDGRLFSSRETFFLIERTRKTLKKLLQHSGLKFLSSGCTFCTPPHSASYEAFFSGFDFTCTTKTHNLRTLALSKCSIVYSILQLAKECLQRNVQVTISVLENAIKHTERMKASRLLSRLLGVNRALKSASWFLSCDEWKSLAAVLLNLGMKIALQCRTSGKYYFNCFERLADISYCANRHLIAMDLLPSAQDYSLAPKGTSGMHCH